MEQPLIINGQKFQHVKSRHFQDVSVYSGENTFLRIGPRELLEKEASFHRQILELGFPVPKLLEEGEINGRFYYIETSFGNKHLGEIFTEDIKKTGTISEEHFQAFLDVTRAYIKAQLLTISGKGWPENFDEVMHIEVIYQELPDLKEKTQQAVLKVKDRLKSVPNVLSHIDYNPFNLFEKGIIDLERFSYAPLGYDATTGIVNGYNFPKFDANGYMRGYWFTEKQIQDYMIMVDNLYEEAGQTRLSDLNNDYIFLRNIWSTVRMERWPDLQKWRYELFNKVLEAYIADEVLLDFVAKS